MAKISRKLQTQKRHKRLRRYIIGSETRPRLAVFRSNNHIYAQVIDDNAQQTICSASTVDKELKEDSEKLSSKVLGELLTLIILVFKRSIDDIMPIMTITISNSINVNPSFLFKPITEVCIFTCTSLHSIST